MLKPLAGRVLVRRIDAVRSGLLWLPEVADPEKAVKGEIVALGPKVRGLKRGEMIAFTGRWDDLPPTHPLPKDYQLIREGDVMGIFN